MPPKPCRLGKIRREEIQGSKLTCRSTHERRIHQIQTDIFPCSLLSALYSQNALDVVAESNFQVKSIRLIQICLKESYVSLWFRLSLFNSNCLMQFRFHPLVYFRWFTWLRFNSVGNGTNFKLVNRSHWIKSINVVWFRFKNMALYKCIHLDPNLINWIDMIQCDLHLNMWFRFKKWFECIRRIQF